MNIGFTGHRDRIVDEQSLLRIEENHPGATWIHGGADGFDTQVHQVALRLGKVVGETLIVIRPNYKAFKPTIAPLIRNHRIVEQADLVVVCWDGRQKGGTAYTRNYAIQQSKPIQYLTPREP